MDPFLKIAYEEGQRIAAEELKEKLRQEIRKREALVGWKQDSVAPRRLSQAKE